MIYELKCYANNIINQMSSYIIIWSYLMAPYYILLLKKLTQVYSRYPCEKPLMERVFVRTG